MKPQVRRHATLVSGSGFPQAEQNQVGEELPFFKVVDVALASATGILKTPASSISREAARRLRASVIPAGSTVLPKIGAALFGNGRAMTTVPCCIDNNLLAVIPRPGLIPRYCFYALSAMDVAPYAQPGPVPSLNVRAMAEAPFLLRTIQVQSAIADYLDRETARIDALIAAKVRMVELVDERWQTVMHDAVSGRLSESPAPRRVSGLPWLGDIPAHWKEGQLKLVAKLGSGHTPSRSHPEWWVDPTIPWITTGEVAQMRSDRIEHILETGERISEVGMENSSAELHPAGTVVLCRTASAGYSAIMGRDMATSQDFATWTCGPMLKPRFLLLCLRAMRQDLLGRLAMGSTHKTIYMPDLESIAVPLPRAAAGRHQRCGDWADRHLGGGLSSVSEKLLEDEISAHLVAGGGYRVCKVGTDPAWRPDFDSSLGLDTAELFRFIEETQGSQWEKLVKAHGGDEGLAYRKFAQRLAQQIDERGTVDVLRHGVRDQNVEFRLSYRRPAFGVAPELVAHYNANQLTVTRQLPYDPDSNRTLDLCLLVNGIPVATAELKNHLTGQNVEDAIKQYRGDRDPRNLTLSRRALVHFAVDPDAVAMTTRLEGGRTRFLPFNRGHELGKGNPPNPAGHKTAYLWEQVWAKDAWLDILHRFIHVERPSKGSLAARRAAEAVIFPRYHQWDAVLKLEADAAANGAGRSYLVQHSAGSGKSNTIAWTAHRLSTLHTDEDRKAFDKVIVITDRVILDSQLQETIHQFEHARGVVVRIDKDSTQLAEALAGEQARIVITTLQKFPFVLDKVGELPDRNYAVVVDEAHSSQTGEAAKELRLVLGAGEEAELTAAEAEDADLLDAAVDPVEDAVAKSVGARSARQSNLSYFAFTATPKGRTLEMFGSLNPDTGVHEPFHLYSMRQAIEEGFIMDVLASYTTYKTFWKIERATEEDPEYDAKKARQAIARFVSLHPHHLAQKAEIIVEHFRGHTAKEMGGAAKAMVVTSSRLHAVRYKQNIDRYIKAKGYIDIATLVAFSGNIDDGTGVPLTEANMNGFPESQTAARFAGSDFGVLIVAEKFQTGFDQPLLHTMYVDKTLVGLAAVQTLSRLNRIHLLKESTFVLDFRNETEDIVSAFDQFHGVTVAPPTDPNILWDTRRSLDNYDVLRPEEIEAALPPLLDAGPSEEKRSAAAYAALAPAKGRFEDLGDEERPEFRDALTRFVRTYSFVAQISAFTDPGLEADYVFCRALASYLRDASTVERLDLGSEVELTHLRHQMTFSGSLELSSEVGEVRSFFGEGKGAQRELGLERLSSIVEILNDRFGTDLTDVDKLLLDQFEEDWVADDELSDQAKNNSIENFGLVFNRKFLNTIVARVDTNEEIFKKILDDEEFKSAVEGFYLRKVYERLRQG